jgi:hypothetical protein
MPALLLDLERLVGYLPQTPDERTRLSDEIASALGTVGDEAFEARVAEMLGSRIARHATITTTSKCLDAMSIETAMDSTGPSNLRYLTLPYPETIVVSNAHPEQRTVVATERLWKRLLRPPPVATDALGRLLGLLAGCDRTLTWKASMRREIVRLAFEEERRAEIADHEFHRPDQLRQLYAVREALEQEVQRAAGRVSHLERERDQVVAQRLELRRWQEGGSDAGDILASGIFSLPFQVDEDETDENGSSPLSDGGAIGEESDAEDCDAGSEVKDALQESNEDDAYSVRSELEGSENGGLPSQDSTADSTQPSASPNHMNLSGRRSPSGPRRRSRRLQQQERVRERALEEAKARRDKEAMQRACTIPELASQQAVLLALDRRLRQVDELIETLQEEEWKDEEEHEERAVSDDDDGYESNEGDSDDPVRHGELSVLDEILAMILGATSPKMGNPATEAHLAWIQAEHRSVVKQWKERFGCLPPPLRRQDDSSQNVPAATTAKTSTPQLRRQPREEDLGDNDTSLKDVGPPDVKLQEQLRKSFGIEDKDVDHWEEGEDEDDRAAKEEVKVLCLRPRGRASR